MKMRKGMDRLWEFRVMRLSIRAQKGGVGLKKEVISLAARMSNSISRSGKLMPPWDRGRVAVVSVGGWDLDPCQMICMRMDLICLWKGRVGGATEA